MTLKDYEILKNILDDNDEEIGIVKTKGSTLKEIISRCDKISYNKVYLTLLKFESNGWVEHGLARGREKAYILTDKGIKLLNEIIGGED